jgi:teichuronic acid biosynthesis glycosyltransferase TuaG
MPFFSVITPAYNAEKYIDATIKSILNQTCQDWEMIIVDDESTDQTVDIVTNYCKTDSRIKLIKQKNKKQAAARNTGIRVAVGEWISFLDSDDYWLPEMLEIQSKYIKSENPDVIYTGGYLFDNHTGIKEEYQTFYGKLTPEFMLKELYRSNPVPVQSAIIKASMIRKAGMLDEDLDVVGCEDLDYWIRLAKCGAVFYGINVHQFMYRRHTENISKNIFQMRLGLVTVLIKNFDKSYLEKKEIIPFFYKQFDALLLDLIESNRIGQAKILLNKFKKIHSAVYVKVNYFFLNALGKISYYPIKFINKLNSSIATVVRPKFNS